MTRCGKKRRSGGRIVVLAWVLCGCGISGQEPQEPPAAPPPPKTWSGTAGVGLSLTSGNSDTMNYNVAFDFTHDPKTRNIVRFTGLYLRGEQDGDLTANRTSLGIRDQYAVTPQTYVFGQVDYMRDTFKLINYLVAPTAGVGSKLIDRELTKFSVDGGVGAVWEKNPERLVRTNAAITASETFVHQVTATTTLKQGTTALWKVDNLKDGLYTFSIGLGTRISEHFQLSVDVLDTFKSRPPTEATGRNDVAVVTAFTAKY